MNTFDDLVPHQQLRSLVSEQIRNAILQGKYKPGAWLRQQHLAEELGVSQMPVREALKELTAEGLIEHIPYRGARVIKISKDDVIDLYAYRAFLESRAAGEAAKRIIAAELATLRQIHEQIAAHQSPDHINVYRQLNRQFHELIYKASQRSLLIRTLDQIWSTFPNMLWSNFAQTAVSPLPSRDATDLQEHAAILNALASHNAEDAAHWMHQHITLAGEELVAVLQPKEF